MTQSSPQRQTIRVLAAALSALFAALITLRIGYAQTALPQTGINASSGLSYVQRYNPDWAYAAIALRPDGQQLAIGGSDGHIGIYDANFDLLADWIAHTGNIWALDWSPEGTKIASGGQDTSVHVWDVNTHATTLTLPHSNTVVAVSWSPDGMKLATVDSAVVFFDSETNAYTEDVLHVWDVSAGGAPVFSALFYNHGSTVSWSPDGERIAVGGAFQVDQGSDLLIWDAVEGYVLDSFPRIWSMILPVAWSPDGSRIAYGDRNGESGVYVVDALSGAFVTEVVSSFDSITALAWHPDGHSLATGTMADSAIYVTHIPTGYFTRMDGHPSAIRSLDWSADGNTLASASTDGTVRIWDMRALPDLSGTPTLTPRPTYIPKPVITATPRS
jgi:WD40 repeat protein